MKCNSCGEEIREDAQFCGFCGAQQGEEPVEVVVPVEESVTADMQPPMKEMTPDAEAVTTEEPMTEIPVLEVAHPVQPEPETPAEPEPMPVIVPAVEPQPEPEPAPEPIPEPVAAPAPQPVVAPAPQPVVAPAPQPAQQPVVAPAPQPAQQPVVAPAPQPVQQPVVAPVPQPVQQPVVAPAPQPVYQAPPQPVYQAPQPVYQAPPQPVYQAPQPVYQAPPQPVYQAPQPVYQAPPQPVYQAPPQPVYQAPRPQYQPAPQYQAPRPQYQPAPAQQRPAIQLPTGRGLIKLWLLTLITLGIYPLVMWSRMSVEINMVASRYDGKRTTHFLWMPVLSGLTLGIYMFVWLHKLCNRIGNELKRRNVAYKFSAATFWLWTFVYGIVGGVVTGVVGFLLTYLEIDPMIISVVTGVLGLASSVGAAVFGHKILKAMNLMNKDYNEKG